MSFKPLTLLVLNAVILSLIEAQILQNITSIWNAESIHLIKPVADTQMQQLGLLFLTSIHKERVKRYDKHDEVLDQLHFEKIRRIVPGFQRILSFIKWDTYSYDNQYLHLVKKNSRVVWVIICKAWHSDEEKGKHQKNYYFLEHGRHECDEHEFPPPNFLDYEAEISHIPINVNWNLPTLCSALLELDSFKAHDLGIERHRGELIITLKLQYPFKTEANPSNRRIVIKNSKVTEMVRQIKRLKQDLSMKQVECDGINTRRIDDCKTSKDEVKDITRQLQDTANELLSTKNERDAAVTRVEASDLDLQNAREQMENQQNETSKISHAASEIASKHEKFMSLLGIEEAKWMALGPEELANEWKKEHQQTEDQSLWYGLIAGGTAIFMFYVFCMLYLSVSCWKKSKRKMEVIHPIIPIIPMEGEKSIDEEQEQNDVVGTKDESFKVQPLEDWKSNKMTQRSSSDLFELFEGNHVEDVSTTKQSTRQM